MEIKNNNHFLSLIVPVYRQETIIVKNLKAVSKVLDKIRYDYEIIVVIDGLVDNSLKNIKKAKLPKVKTIS